MREILQALASVGHTLQQRSGLEPAAFVARRLLARGADLKSMDGLELFGGDGTQTTGKLVPYFRSFETWDIDPEVCARLRAEMPLVRVMAVDSFQQLREEQRTFDFVSADTYPWIYGGEHYDNFELFPGVFRILKPTGYLQLNLTADWNLARFADAEAFSPECRRRRAEFFRCADPARLTVDQMVARYVEVAAESGYHCEWSFTQDRYPFYALRRRSKKWRLLFLVMKLVRDGVCFAAVPQHRETVCAAP